MNDLYGPLDEKRKKRKKAGTESSKESSLRDWFGRKGAKGKKKGWVDCNAPDGKGGYKSCGRSGSEKRKIKIIKIYINLVCLIDIGKFIHCFEKF